MSKVAIYNLEGVTSSSKTLNDSVFSVAENGNVISQTVVWQQNNQRKANAHTKMRGEVSGGGRKPHKQKGTGRARAGSSRSPLWTGGGITFGPRNDRNYKTRLPKVMRQNAIKMALSQKIKEKKLIVLDSFKLEKINTAKVRQIFEKLPIEEGKILVILEKLDANIELSLANVPYVKVIKVENINIIDILKYDYIVTTLNATDMIVKNLTCEEVK